jgi:hypothetical protein
MQSDGKPANVFARALRWADGLPPWMNSLAHFVCIWLVGGVLSVAFLMWWHHRSLKESFESLGVGAFLAATTYAVASVVHQFGHRRKTS